jgi:hypothetical protein
LSTLPQGSAWIVFLSPGTQPDWPGKTGTSAMAGFARRKEEVETKNL